MNCFHCCSGKRKIKTESEEADKEEEPMEVEETSDDQTSSKKAKKSAETPKTGGSGRKRRLVACLTHCFFLSSDFITRDDNCFQIPT